MATRKTETKNKRTAKKAGILLTDVQEQEVNEAVTEDTEVSEPIVETEPLEPYRQVLKKLESEAIERNHNLLSTISDTLLHLSPTKEQEAQLNTLANTYWGQVLNSNATFEYKAEAVLSGVRNLI